MVLFIDESGVVQSPLPRRDEWVKFWEENRFNPDCDGWPKTQAPGRKNRIVYFLQCGSSSLIKIGSSGNLKRRIYEIRQSLPLGSKFLSWTPGGEIYEKYLHDFFLKHYAHYLGLVRELDRCEIEPKPLHNSVRSIIEKFRPYYSFEKYDLAAMISA